MKKEAEGCVRDYHKSAFHPEPNSLLSYIRKNRDITLFDNFAKEISESQ